MSDAVESEPHPDVSTATVVPHKNIVLCLDGTGNEYGSRNTNVLLLHECLEQDSAKQVTYYDPGVGTFAVTEKVTGIARFWELVLGLAFGRGFRQNVVEAYSFVMKHYNEGDKIFIYGFSRGAYTARVVAGLIHKVGILHPGLENLVPYALRYLQMDKGNLDFKRIAKFSKQFRAHKAEPNIFLGLWDTVSSVSWAFDRQVYAYTTKNDSVATLRHAVAIDEKRSFFSVSRFAPFEESSGHDDFDWSTWDGARDYAGRDYKEVWFAGAHSDVGGGYSDVGLSRITLEWMIVESRKTGLRINEHAARRVFDPESGGAAPDAYALRHESLGAVWWPAEFWPRIRWDWTQKLRSLWFNCGERRALPAQRFAVHQSVEVRADRSDYDMPESSSVESHTEENEHARVVEPWIPLFEDLERPESDPADHYEGARLRGPLSFVTVATFLTWFVGAATRFAYLGATRTVPSDWSQMLLDAALWPAWASGYAWQQFGAHPTSSAWLAFACFLLGVGTLNVLRPCRHLPREGQVVPHLQVKPRPSAAVDFFVRLNPQGRTDYRRALIADLFPFLPWYLLTFVALLAVSADGFGAGFWIPVGLIGAGAAADLCENLLLLKTLSRTQDMKEDRGLTRAGRERVLGDEDRESLLPLCRAQGTMTTVKALAVSAAYISFFIVRLFGF